MITVSSWPDNPAENQYLKLYYGTLAEYGIVQGPSCALRISSSRNTSGGSRQSTFSGFRNRFWRSRGRSAFQRLRGVVGFWKFLRIARRLGIRVLWTLHDIEHHEGSGLIDRLGCRLLAGAADLCICHDKWAANQLMRRYGGRADRIVIMPHGNYDGVFPDPQPRVETLHHLGVPEGRKLLLCQGNVRPYKRFDLAIEAARLLGEEYHLIVAGHAPEAAWGEALQRQAAGLGNVTLLLERFSDQTLADLACAADCFVLPYQRITGSGALLTAATLGRGVVASDLPYFRKHWLVEPESCVLFTPGEAPALASAVRTFFDCGSLIRGQAARRLADRFDWDRVVQPVVDWYRRTFPVLAASDLSCSDQTSGNRAPFQ